jgi:hypothetical protein
MSVANYLDAEPVPSRYGLADKHIILPVTSQFRINLIKIQALQYVTASLHSIRIVFYTRSACSLQLPAQRLTSYGHCFERHAMNYV